MDATHTTETTMTTTWLSSGICSKHGVTPNERGNCGCCEMNIPAIKAEPLTGIEAEWARSTTARMQPGGDLYRAPLSREQMTAPLSWFEAQMAVVNRYGVLEDGSIGWVRIAAK